MKTHDLTVCDHLDSSVYFFLYDYGIEDRVAVSTTVLVSYNEQGPRVFGLFPSLLFQGLNACSNVPC
jgi:hypothetical protein